MVFEPSKCVDEGNMTHYIEILHAIKYVISMHNQYYQMEPYEIFKGPC